MEIISDAADDDGYFKFWNSFSIFTIIVKIEYIMIALISVSL